MTFIHASCAGIYFFLGAAALARAEEAQSLPPAPMVRSAEETVAAFRLPDGFKATVFAAEPDVVQPIAMAIDDRGRVWVAEGLAYPNWSPEGNDRILVLEDTNGDGRHDKRTVFYDKLNYVTGLEVGFGGVFVVSAPSLLFIPDKNHDDRADADPEILLDGFGHQGVHNLVNGCTWGPDGWLYGGHGGSSSGYVGRPEDSDDQRTFFDGGVWRYHPTKKVFESFMEGTTNPWGIDFNEYGHAFISNSVTPHLYHVIQMAATDPSPLVCLYLASAAQRLDDQTRWRIIEALAARESLAEDQNLPLMTWYALEPVVKSDPARALKLATSSKFPRLREYVARRIASGNEAGRENEPRRHGDTERGNEREKLRVSVSPCLRVSVLNLSTSNKPNSLWLKN